MSEQDGDRNVSKQEIGTIVQQALALCATCSHVLGDHRDRGGCEATWHVEGSLQHCKCVEFWPIRETREDSWPVMGHEVGLGGAVEVALNKRRPTEFWDSLRSGRQVRITVTAEVVGKGFKLVRGEGGFVVGVHELRKLKALCVDFDELDEETGELS